MKKNCPKTCIYEKNVLSLRQKSNLIVNDMRIWITIAESLSTDNEYSSEVYLSTTPEDAEAMATSLIAEMVATMNLGTEIDPVETRILEGDGWFYRVRVESHLLS